MGNIRTAQEGVISALRRFLFFALAAAVFVPSLKLHALDPGKEISQYVLDVRTSDDGLPQNSIYVILQTRDGYLWMGTEEGLVRFDGVRFTVFDKGNTPEIKQNQINALYEDHEGNLWIGTQGGGLVRLQNGKFTLYSTKEGLLNDNVWSILEDHSGNLWVGTSDGMDRISNGKMTAFTKKQGLINDSVWCIYEGHDLSLWIGTSGGLDRMKDGKLTSFTDKEGLHNNVVISLYEGRDGSLWIGTSGGGLSRLQDGKITTYTNKEGLNDNTVVSVLEDKDGSLWAGTFGGLNRLRNGRFDSFGEKQGLSSDVVTSLFEDREGSLWIGTTGGGLDHLSDGKFLNYTTEEGLSNDMATSIFEDRESNLWIGTYGGLNKLRDGKITVYSKKDGLTNDNVRSLYIGSDGVLWIGTYGGGVNRYHDGKFTSYSTQNGLSNNKVWSLIQDHDGAVWVGTSGGLDRIRDGKVTVYTTRDGLSSDVVSSLVEDINGNLWIGTFNGLSRYRDGKFTIYNSKDGLTNENIISQYADAEGNLWIGTHGGGLNRLKNGKIASYTSQDGLFNDEIFQILEDSKNNLWISCNKGIFRINKKELDDFDAGKTKSIHSFSYGKTDGMKTQECDGGSEPAGYKTKDGKLWFPTIDGITMIDPENIRTNKVPPPVIVESLVADGQTVFESGAKTVSTNTVESGTQKLEFHYTALSFPVPHRVEFKYRLDGFDHDWVDAGARRTAYYTNIRPGEYTFHVKAANNDGIWSEADAILPFVLKPRFYQTVWFYLLCASSLVFVGWNLNRYRLGRALALERVRSRIASDLHDDIGSGLSQISILSEVAQQNSSGSDQQELLAKIATTSREVLDSISDIVWAVNPNRDHMTDLVQRMRRFASDIFTGRGIQFRFDIAGLESNLGLDPDLRRNIYLIFKESINNIVRHSACTSASISLSLQERIFVMKVSDNGQGYSSIDAISGHGLESMRARATAIGGTFFIETAKESGTHVTIKVPVGWKAKTNSEFQRSEGQK